MIWSQSAPVTSRASWLNPTPALLTSTSMRPRSASTAATAASIEAWSVTSSSTADAEPPAARTSASRSARSSVRRAAATTCAPAAASATTRSRPIPREAPVTSAT